MDCSFFKNGVTAAIMLLIIGSCSNVTQHSGYDSREDYKLLTEYSPEATFWIKRHIIDYFVMVALGSEYGSEFKISRKWNAPMYMYVKGNHDPSLLYELQEIISDINSLAQDDFYIQIVEKEADANFIAFFGSKQDYNQLFPGVSELLRVNNGLFRVTMDDFVITQGNLFVNADLPSLITQKHLLREELTQALGLGNDINHYPNSIFYQQPSKVTEYTINDKEIIRLLYHPRMIAGLSEKSVRNILEDILGL